MPECTNCTYKSNIERLEKADEQNKKAHRNFYDRFEKYSNEQTRIDERYNNICATLEEMKTSLTIIQNSAGKKWNALSQTTVGAVVGGVIAIIISFIFE